MNHDEMRASQRLAWLQKRLQKSQSLKHDIPSMRKYHDRVIRLCDEEIRQIKTALGLKDE